MFHPIRHLEVLQDENSSWWKSYLKRTAILFVNPQTAERLSNSQNYYESFCQTSVNGQERDFSNTNYHHIVDSENVDQELDQNNIHLWTSCNIHLEVTLAEISTENIEDPFVTSYREPASARPGKKLQKHIEKALQQHPYVLTATKSGEPPKLYPSFPTLEQHSCQNIVSTTSWSMYPLVCSASQVNKTPALQVRSPNEAKLVTTKKELIELPCYRQKARQPTKLKY